MLLDQMDTLGFINAIPLSGMTKPLVGNNPYALSFHYCAGTNLFVGWIADYTCRESQGETPKPITMDSLKSMDNIFIASDPNFFKYKGSVVYNEFWFELPPTVIEVPSHYLDFKDWAEVDSEPFQMFTRNGFEVFLHTEEARFLPSKEHRGVIIFNPLKYIKHINHRFVSAHERY